MLRKWRTVGVGLFDEVKEARVVEQQLPARRKEPTLLLDAEQRVQSATVEGVKCSCEASALKRWAWLLGKRARRGTVEGRHLPGRVLPRSGA